MRVVTLLPAATGIVDASALGGVSDAEVRRLHGAGEPVAAAPAG